jgi:hypothetical protein
MLTAFLIGLGVGLVAMGMIGSAAAAYVLFESNAVDEDTQ